MFVGARHVYDAYIGMVYCNEHTDEWCLAGRVGVVIALWEAQQNLLVVLNRTVLVASNNQTLMDKHSFMKNKQIHKTENADHKTEKADDTMRMRMA